MTETNAARSARRVKLILFGATGMVGQGALLECLDDPEVERVLAVVRRPTGKTHEKLEELVVKDFTDYSDVEDRLRGYDACLFCLGVSAPGMTEAEYRRVTYDDTLAVAQTLARLNPDLTFCYVSGSGTDSTEKGRQMWARVKGKVENDLLALPLGAAHVPTALHDQSIENWQEVIEKNFSSILRQPGHPNQRTAAWSDPHRADRGPRRSHPGSCDARRAYGADGDRRRDRRRCGVPAL